MAYIAFTIYSLFMLFNLTHSQCEWTVGDNTLDLSCLKGRTIKSTDDAGHLFTYSMCENSAGSCSGGQSLMVKQVYADDTSHCYEIATWDQQKSPTYNADIDAWTFDYQNGETCQGELVRSWAPTFVCDRNTELNAGTVTEMLGSCRYSIQIATKFACKDVECALNGYSSGLSGGWIFIILLLCGLFTYCVVGYIVRARTVNKHRDFLSFNVNNIPHRPFWKALPALVMAGCNVTKEITQNFINKRRGTNNDITAPMHRHTNDL